MSAFSSFQAPDVMSISLPKKARLVSDGSCQSGDAGQAVRERWQSQALLRPNNKRKTYTGIEDTGGKNTLCTQTYHKN